MSPKFRQDLIQGRVGEKYVAEMFRNWGLRVSEAPQSYFPDYDLLAEGVLHGKQVRFSCEVKTDRKFSQTQNIYLELKTLQKSKASILTICLNDPIDTVLMLPLQDALRYAISHKNITGGDYKDAGACIGYHQFISDLKPKVLTTKQCQ